jgi:hypothetical protein
MVLMGSRLPVWSSRTPIHRRRRWSCIHRCSENLLSGSQALIGEIGKDAGPASHQPPPPYYCTAKQASSVVSMRKRPFVRRRRPQRYQSYSALPATRLRAARRKPQSARRERDGASFLGSLVAAKQLSSPGRQPSEAATDGPGRLQGHQNAGLERSGDRKVIVR